LKAAAKSKPPDARTAALDEGDAQRAWAKVASTAPVPASAAEPVLIPIAPQRQEVIRRVLAFDFRGLRPKLASR
jgi:hypothetical protein